MSKAPPHSIRKSTWLVGGSKNTLHRDDRDEVQVNLSERNGDSSDMKDNGVGNGIEFITSSSCIVLFLFVYLFFFLFLFSLIFIFMTLYILFAKPQTLFRWNQHPLKALFSNQWWE